MIIDIQMPVLPDLEQRMCCWKMRFQVSGIETELPTDNPSMMETGLPPVIGVGDLVWVRTTNGPYVLRTLLSWVAG